ncbi:O-antigen ligase family protein [Nodosilinea sp. LEGE 07088]|uniref:O-antigen ligase family protein n=1 Tax=Nodosilinea sp. LEGE 07088 TaxID=2777968 RepID=UPI00187E41E8|nr:O-antigen ligase family protein [Nodosilinea sp. LEGE 07088]MBE9140735.1 O-antigen ligase family protein [Nodosilinea sp. LEGE 07088]
MEPTSRKNVGVGGFTLERLVSTSLVVLPYFIYGAVITLGSFLIASLHRWSREIGQILYRQGWVWLALGFGINVVLSQAPGESAVQALNFVPFFVFYAAVAVALPTVARPLRVLRHWGVALLVATVPINLAAIAEFYLRAPSSLSRWGNHPGLQWLYAQTDYGHRASAVFGHPNALANYMVIVFGLGLGLCAHYLSRPGLRRQGLWLGGATALVLVGIFCSGSRSGLLIAGLQLLLFGGLLRPYRYIFWAGLGAIALMTVSALIWGIGGRTLGEAFATVSLRFSIWHIALDMIPQHFWFGSGLGTFKQLYNPADFPVVNDFLPHAHNLWLMLAVEAGVPMAVGFTAVVGWVVGHSTHALLRHPLATDSTALLAGYLTGFGGTVAFSIFDLAFYDARINILGWLMLGIIQGMGGLAARAALKST